MVKPEQEKNERETTHYFITLEIQGKAPWLAEANFRTQVEQMWSQMMQQATGFRDAGYVVNDTALHALISLPKASLEVRENLHHSIVGFMQQTQTSWSDKETLWVQEYKLRVIESTEELSSLRDFIVQKMLGGKELSDLEEATDEDDFFDYP